MATLSGEIQISYWGNLVSRVAGRRETGNEVGIEDGKSGTGERGHVSQAGFATATAGEGPELFRTYFVPIADLSNFRRPRGVSRPQTKNLMNYALLKPKP